MAALLVVIAGGFLTIPGVTIGPTAPAVVQVVTSEPEVQVITATAAPTDVATLVPTQEATLASVEIPTSTSPPISIENPPLGQQTDGATTTDSGSASVLPTSTTQPQFQAQAAPGDTSVGGAVQVIPSATSQVTLSDDLILDTDNPAGGGGAVAEEEIPAILDLLKTDMVEVPGGTFQMGTTLQEAAQAVRECVDVFGGACDPAMAEDSFPPRQITVGDFQIERTEVTYEQYIAFLNVLGARQHLNGCDGNPCLQTQNESDTSNISFDGQTYDVPDVINNLPVVSVTWYGASAYCETLNRRLPTEAEWEFAARGPNGNIYPWGSGLFDTTRAKTNRPIPESAAEVGAVPVGTYPTGASPFGALDMAGNAAEWVVDWYSPDHYSQSPSATDPQGPLGGTERVVRGGSWDAVPFFARSVHRQSLVPNDARPWLGFRCVAAPEDALTGGAVGNQPLIPANPIEQDAALGLGTTTDGVNTSPTLPPEGGAEEAPLATLAP